MCGPEENHSHHSSESSHQPSHLDNSNRKPRTLVLCFDGTNDVFDDDNTNVIRLFAALEKARPNEQLVYYQPGIGTYVRPEAPWAPHIRDVAKRIDQGFAWYIGTHITGGYKFLMQHYNEGDRICLFGFSRGAFTARCLAGMLHKVGLLPRSNTEHVDFAYSLYESEKDADRKRARDFKKTFSVHVEVEFIGVWDTVASVGLGAPTLPFNASETFVRTFRHALAIDERRAKFMPSTWKYRKSCECGSGGRTQTDPYKTIQELIEGTSKGSTGSPHAGCAAKKDSLCWCKEDERYHGGLLTDVREVWFAGAHADVGGGYDKDDSKNSPANPPLRWMVTEILKAKAGVIFKKDAFEEVSPYLAAKVKAFQHASESPSYFEAESHHHGHTLEVTVKEGSIVTPPLTPGSSYIKKSHEGMTPVRPELAVENVHHEAIAELHDELGAKWLWYILECLPLTQTWMKEDGTEVTRPHFNFGRHRIIEHPRPYFHKSVEYRKDKWTDKKKSGVRYTPYEKCRNKGTIEYVHEDDDLPEYVRARLAGGSFSQISIYEYSGSGSVVNVRSA